MVVSNIQQYRHIVSVVILGQPCSLWSHPAIFLYRWVCIRAAKIQASTLVAVLRLKKIQFVLFFERFIILDELKTQQKQLFYGIYKSNLTFYLAFEQYYSI